MSDIDPFAGLTTFPTTTGSSAEPESLQKSGLGRDAFLNIFLTQLQNQDPLSPQDASQLGAQLATFSQVEQQTLMAEQLRGVNSRLDSMLEALKGSPAGALDPVALIGKQVEVSSSSLRADGGESEVLRFDVTESGMQSLLISGETANGKTIGLATLGVMDGASELPRGTYELRIGSSGMQLELPNHRVLSAAQLPLTTFVKDATTGQPHSVVAGSPGAPVLVPIESGSSHDLAVGTRDRQGAYKPLTTRVDGSVSAVRVVDGKTVVTVNGSDRDLSKVIQVQ